MTSKKMCVVGCGHWGKNLVRTFSSLGAFDGVCDADPERAAALAAAHSVPRTFADFEAALDNPAVDAVAIATPAEVHYEFAMAAFAAGKRIRRKAARFGVAGRGRDGSGSTGTQADTHGGPPAALSSRDRPAEAVDC
jgi:hypothetical protein